MKKLWLLLAVPVLIILGTVAYASIPSSDGVIHGCYRTTNGDLRVIDSEATCDTDETALNWNAEHNLLDGIEGVGGSTGPVAPDTGTSVDIQCPPGKIVMYSEWNNHDPDNLSVIGAQIVPSGSPPVIDRYRVRVQSGPSGSTDAFGVSASLWCVNPSG